MQLLLFGLAVKPGPLSAVALRGLEDCTPLLLGVECALHACHGGVPILVRSSGVLRSAVEHLLHAAGVVGRHRGTAVEATGALARLVLQEVALVGLLAHDLAGSGDAEALRRSAVGLGLGHAVL